MTVRGPLFANVRTGRTTSDTLKISIYLTKGLRRVILIDNAKIIQ